MGLVASHLFTMDSLLANICHNFGSNILCHDIFSAIKLPCALFYAQSLFLYSFLLLSIHLHPSLWLPFHAVKYTYAIYHLHLAYKLVQKLIGNMSL